MQAPQSEKSEKSNIITISEDKKKKKEGAQKKGVKIHPFHLPWIRAYVEWGFGHILAVLHVCLVFFILSSM